MSTKKEYIQKNSVVLIGFITLSLLAHGTLFLFQSKTDYRPTQASLGANWLSISLISTDIETKSSTITPEKPAIKRPLQKTLQKTVERKTVAKKPAQIIVRAHDSPTTTTTKSKKQTTSNLAQRNFLLGEIQHRLSRFLSYPVRARRRGWQGEVMVGFHVDKQGVLHNVHLTQTSGYSLLDNAALNAIGSVKNIPLSSWFKNNNEGTFHPIALQLPVSYRLTNS